MYEDFERKYRECEKALFLTAVGYVHNTEDAKDCLQEAALSALRAYGGLKDKELFKTWITRILINKCRDMLRKRKYADGLSDNMNVFCCSSESDIEILDAVCKLGEELSVYITLYYYNDMTYEQIAKVMRQSVSTVKYRTKKALKVLKKDLCGGDDE